MVSSAIWSVRLENVFISLKGRVIRMFCDEKKKIMHILIFLCTFLGFFFVVFVVVVWRVFSLVWGFLQIQGRSLYKHIMN